MKAPSRSLARPVTSLPESSRSAYTPMAAIVALEQRPVATDLNRSFATRNRSELIDTNLSGPELSSRTTSEAGGG